MNIWGDFPGGPVVKHLPSNAGSSGLIPDLETKTPHTPVVVQLLSPPLWSLPAATREAHVHQRESHVLQLRLNFSQINIAPQKRAQ